MMRKLIIMAALSLTTAACTDHFEKGREAMLRGQYDEAIAHLTPEAADTAKHARAGEACAYLSECYAHKGDSAAAHQWLRQAAMLYHLPSARTYELWLKENPQKIDEYIAFYEKMHAHVPHYGYWAAMLAKPYLFDNTKVDSRRAGELIMPFVSKTGTALERGTQLNEAALAAYMLANGSGGYVDSPECAIKLVEDCRGDLQSYRGHEGYDMDADALAILGDLEPLCTPDFKNVGRALEYYKAALEMGPRYMSAAQLQKKIEILTDFETQRDKARVNALWWERKPTDWATYRNDNGFFYYGHTNASGSPKGNDNNQYPTGMGYGLWDRDHTAFVGYWQGGQPSRGLYITPTRATLWL